VEYGVRFVPPLLRPILGALLGALAIVWIASAPPAQAQGGPSLIRDTEVERVVRAVSKTQKRLREDPEAGVRVAQTVFARRSHD